MAEADSHTIDPSVRGVQISDLITRRIIAAAPLCAAPEFADGRSLTDAANLCTFLLVFWKSWASHRFSDPTIPRPVECEVRISDPDRA
jgi:hypothetical protein